MEKRKCYRVFKPGSLNRLKFVDEDIRLPEHHEVLIEVKAIGLNYADIFAILGLYSATPKEPFIPGLEFAGVILQVGSAVSGLKEGDRVFGVTRFGAYTTHITIDHRYVLPIPQSYNLNEAAAFPGQGLTAYYALKQLGDIKEGQNVFIQSAAGGVGILANRIAKKYNAFTIGSVGRKSKLDLLEKEGYDRFFVRTSGTFRQKLAEAIEDRDLHLVLESAGGEYFNHAYDALAPMGRLVTFGSATFTPQGKSPFWPKLIWQYLTRPKVDPMKMVSDNKSVMAFNLIWLYEHNDLFQELMNELLQLNIEPPHIGQEYDFQNLPVALNDFRKGGTTGKVIVNV